MNNIVLQKLITAHNLIPDKGGILSNNDGYEFHKTWKSPQYLLGLNKHDMPPSLQNQYGDMYGLTAHIMFESMEEQGMFAMHGEGLDFRNAHRYQESQVKETLRRNAQEVSQAAKFYVDLTGPDQLLDTELEKIITELKIYSPYKSVFLQVETDEYVHNILIKDHMDDLGELDTGVEKVGGFMSFVNYCYVKNGHKGPYFLFDPNTYNIMWHTDMSWVYEINGQGIHGSDGSIAAKPIWHDYLDLQQDAQGRYLNDGLENHVQLIHSSFIQFMVLLQYPMICNVQDVKGRGDIFLDKKVRHTTSELRRQPKFTHKVLRLDLYGSPNQSGGVIEEGKGVAFHSVRKHLRKLPNGKLTWVKAHFRGHKDHGTVFKDYDIDPTKPISHTSTKIH